MDEWKETEKLKVKAVYVRTLADGSDISYQVGHGPSQLACTRIEQFEKSGMHSYIPYLRIWKDDVIVAELCQHNIESVIFFPAD
jgi:hypothetical protein